MRADMKSGRHFGDIISVACPAGKISREMAEKVTVVIDEQFYFSVFTLFGMFDLSFQISELPASRNRYPGSEYLI